MKKRLIFFIPFIFLIIIIFLLLLSKNQNNKKFFLENKYYGNSEITEINAKELVKLENKKESFVVFIHQPFCATSYDLNNYIKEFTNTYKISFYKLPFSEIKNTNIDKYVKYCPSVVIFHKGQIVAFLNADSTKDTKYYESTNNFKKWFTNYVILQKD